MTHIDTQVTLNVKMQVQVKKYQLAVPAAENQQVRERD